MQFQLRKQVLSQDKPKPKNVRYERKLYLLELFGLTCFRCGLGADLGNLPIWHFHHINKNTKRFNVSFLLKLSEGEFMSYVPEILKECVPLCANCHALVTSYARERNDIYYKWLGKQEKTTRLRAKLQEHGLLVQTIEPENKNVN